MFVRHSLPALLLEWSLYGCVLQREMDCQWLGGRGINTRFILAPGKALLTKTSCTIVVMEEVCSIPPLIHGVLTNIARCGMEISMNRERWNHFPVKATV